MFTRTPFCRPLARKILRKVVDRRLRRRIGEHARQRRKPGRRTEIDDAAGTLLDHVLAKNLDVSTRPFKFTVMILSNSSSVMSKNGVGELTPAPLTKMSTRPNFASTSARSFASSALEVASQWKNSALPPSLAILSSRAFAFASSRPTSATVAPAFAKPSAISPHSTPVPPMTTATLPSSENNSAGVFMI